MNRIRLVIIFGSFSAFFAIGSLVAQDLRLVTADVERALLEMYPVQYSPCWAKELIELSRTMNKKADILKSFSLSLETGITGDSAELEDGSNGSADLEGDSYRTDLYKLDLKAALNWQFYPHELRFDAGTIVQYKDKELQENVTRQLVNYDYYWFNFLEAYGFMERFSDSYLNIKERYEIGGGLKLEWDAVSRHPSKDDREESEFMADDTKNGLAGFEKALAEKSFPPRTEFSKESASDPKVLTARIREMKKLRDRLMKGLKKRATLLNFGFAASVLSEIEQAEIETEISDTGNLQAKGTPEKFILPASQRFRVALRPSILIRPSEQVELSGHIYYKLPLGTPIHEGGLLDYRRDALGRLKIDLGGGPAFAKKLTLIFEYENHYDNSPPRIPEEVIKARVDVGKMIKQTVARNNHNIFSMRLGIEF